MFVYIIYSISDGLLETFTEVDTRQNQANNFLYMLREESWLCAVLNGLCFLNLQTHLFKRVEMVLGCSLLDILYKSSYYPPFCRQSFQMSYRTHRQIYHLNGRPWHQDLILINIDNAFTSYDRACSYIDNNLKFDVTANLFWDLQAEFQNWEVGIIFSRETPKVCGRSRR